MTGRGSRGVGWGLLVALLSTACTTGGSPRDPVRTASSTTRPIASPAPASLVSTTPGASTEPSPTASLPSPDPAEPTPIAEAGQPAEPLLHLVSPDGSFDLAELAGHPVLLFFGYTHCPDVCPMTIGELVLVLRNRPDTRAVFVTVDPERDTPEFLAEWTGYLPEGFVALTGPPTAIRAAADAYAVRYARVDSGSAGGYSMSHTAFVHLIDADGRMRATFPFGTGWATMVRAIDGLAGAAKEDPS